MSDSYWLKQARGSALFENLLWSRPENKSFAGKLLVVGGSSNGFSSPATVYNFGTKAGAGSIRVLLPNSLEKSVGPHLEDAVFAPSNMSGGLSRQALAELLSDSEWADLTLLSGDLGRNSETTVLLESFISDYKGPLSLVGDSIDCFMSNPMQLLERPDTLIILDLSKLQKLVTKSRSTKAIKSDMGLLNLIELLHELTEDKKLGIITKHQDHYVVAFEGKVSTTETTSTVDWENSIAAYVSVWWLQNKTQPFQAITTGISDSLVETDDL